MDGGTNQRSVRGRSNQPCQTLPAAGTQHILSLAAGQYGGPKCARGRSNQPWQALPAAGTQHILSLVAGQYGGPKCVRGRSNQPWQGRAVRAKSAHFEVSCRSVWRPKVCEGSLKPALARSRRQRRVSTLRLLILQHIFSW